MTKEEALRLLKTQRIDGDDLHEAFDMAIKALEAQKTDDLIVLQLDCLMRAQDIQDERRRILAQIENDGVVLLPSYMRVAYIGNKCDVKIMYEDEEVGDG